MIITSISESLRFFPFWTQISYCKQTQGVIQCHCRVAKYTGLCFCRPAGTELQLGVFLFGLNVLL